MSEKKTDWIQKHPIFGNVPQIFRRKPIVTHQTIEIFKSVEIAAEIEKSLWMMKFLKGKSPKISVNGVS